MKRNGCNNSQMILDLCFMTDILTILSFYSKTNRLLPLIISIASISNSNINFTMETEQNSHLHFLDTLVKRSSNFLSTSVYHEPSFFGLGLSFFSYTSFIYKINNIKSLISRAYIICSNYSLFHAKLHFLRTYFCDNDHESPLLIW